MRANPSFVMTERFANVAELVVILVVLFMAFALQFILGELPCPLCLLQRFGFLCIAFGFLMNIRFGFRPSHYTIVLLSAVFTAFVALRQIALHVIPGTGSYGSPIFGMHLYTWSFIAAVCVIVSTALLLGVDRQYGQARVTKSWLYIVNLLFLLVGFLMVANMVSVFLECGLSFCPDNPVKYSLS